LSEPAGALASAALTGDREMLQVVFQNILMNAAQAMAGRVAERNQMYQRDVASEFLWR
jgi:nitrogen fixation/metabolism regulation signal transduction histidine kinase